MNRAKQLISLIEEEIGQDAALYHTFDIHDIDNRRFMYNPKTDEMILGEIHPSLAKSSHADEYHQSGARGSYDDFIKGWVGTSKKYPHGVIHFAPPISDKALADPDIADAALKTLEKFIKNGANKNTILRNIGGSSWGERKLKDAFPTLLR